MSAAAAKQLLDGARRLTAPVAESARAELEARARSALDGTGDPFDPADAAGQLARSIGLELALTAAPAVAIELQAARLAGDLDGGSAADRAAAFYGELDGGEFMDENPELARVLNERLLLGIDAGGDLLRRLAADWPRLRSELLGDEPGALTAVEPLGESHDGGRRVLQLDFAGGARLVYKPRSLAADHAYGELLAWLGDAGFEPAFSTPALLARDGYGWQEWVAPAPCDSAAAVERYFARLGGQLAVLHALRGVDFHRENVIACGEHPVLVDLEGLFHPRLGGDRAAVVDPLIAETGLDCVLRVGLLPRADVAFDVDMSGLGGDPAAAIETEEVGWVGADGADVRLGHAVVTMRPGANVPRLGDDPVRPQDQLEPLARGFADAYRTLVRDRDALLAPGGPLAAFDGAETRVILRPSRAYAGLLRAQVSEPAALVDEGARERILDALERGAARRPDLGRAAGAERDDLLRGDVPRFTTSPGQSDGFHHSAGRIEGLLAPERAPAAGEVARLDERDLDRQLGLLRAAVLAATASASPPAARAPGRTPVESAGLSRDAALAAARQMRRRLDVLALREGDRAGWLTAVAAERHSGRVLRVAGPGLTDGHAGIALFLARLAALTGDPDPLAHAAARHLVAQADREPVPNPGLCAGAGGIVWALAHMAADLHDPELAERGAALVAACDDAVAADDRIVLRDGLAGWAIGLAGLLVRGIPVREPAQRCAARLAGATAPANRSLLDGAPGVGLALLRLGQALGHEPELEERGRELAGPRVDRDDPWRTDPGPVELPGLTGLAGIGLAYLAMAESGADPRPSLELPAAPARGTTSRNSSASVGRSSLK